MRNCLINSRNELVEIIRRPKYDSNKSLFSGSEHFHMSVFYKSEFCRYPNLTFRKFKDTLWNSLKTNMGRDTFSRNLNEQRYMRSRLCTTKSLRLFYI